MTQTYGLLAKQWCNKRLSLRVLKSNIGYYADTADEDGPCSRESVEYFHTQAAAQQAFDDGVWTQKETP